MRPAAAPPAASPGRLTMLRNILILLVVSAGCAAVQASRSAAAEDSPAGWSVDLSKPKQAIISYAPEANSPRALIIACMRDSEEFGVYSTGLMDGVRPHGG